MRKKLAAALLCAGLLGGCKPHENSTPRVEQPQPAAQPVRQVPSIPDTAAIEQRHKAELARVTAERDAWVAYNKQREKEYTDTLRYWKEAHDKLAKQGQAPKIEQKPQPISKLTAENFDKIGGACDLEWVEKLLGKGQQVSSRSLGTSMPGRSFLDQTSSSLVTYEWKDGKHSIRVTFRKSITGPFGPSPRTETTFVSKSWY